MANLVAQSIDADGLAAVYTAVTAADDFPTDNRTFLHFKNTSGASVTVTVETTQTVNDLAVADRTLVLPAGSEAFIGPFNPTTFRRSDTGKGRLTYSATASVSVAALLI